MTEPGDLESISRELYGSPPDEFIEARKQFVKQARDSGDRALAAQVQALRKPTMAAWFVNQVARQHADELAVLLDLGRELREGMSGLDGEELRVLTRRRHQLVSALVQLATALGNERGLRLGTEAASGVRATLEATLSDPDSAALVEAGSLTDALQVSGFGFGVVPNPQNHPSEGSRRADSLRSATVADLDAHRERKSGSVERAESDVDAAETALRGARAAAEKAEDRLNEADDLREDAQGRVKRIERKLRKARADLDEQVAAAQAARDVNRQAQSALREAERALAKLQRRLDDLTS